MIYFTVWNFVSIIKIYNSICTKERVKRLPSDNEKYLTVTKTVGSKTCKKNPFELFHPV